MAQGDALGLAQEVSVAPILNPSEASLALNGVSSSTYAPGIYQLGLFCQQMEGGTANLFIDSLGIVASLKFAYKRVLYLSVVILN